MASSNGQNGSQSTETASEAIPSFRPLVLSHLRLVLAIASTFNTLTKVPFESSYLCHLTDEMFNPEHFSDLLFEYSPHRNICVFSSRFNDRSMRQFLFVWSMNSNDFKRRSMLVSSMSMDQGDWQVSRSNSTDCVSKESISHLGDSLINPSAKSQSIPAATHEDDARAHPTRTKPKPVRLQRRLVSSGVAVKFLFLRANTHN